ncbi:MAG TPA: response regulator [Gammaproteobacteria bacterium]|nr:response regulator [Gammaproteobacteria bacterium]
MAGTAQILVIDDDREIRSLLSEYLNVNGYQTTAAADGEQARNAFARQQFDLVVLDLMLPGESGLDICRELRRSGDVPVIMLTALGDETDRIVGLEVGADDYLPKPFSPRELLGRIRAVLRRTGVGQRDAKEREFPVYHFATWRLDTLARTLIADTGEKSQLTSSDARMLEILLAGQGDTVTRADLFDQLHGREFDPLDRSIDVRISRLRQLLGEATRAPAIIKTVHGKGYAIGVDVRVEQ